MSTSGISAYNQYLISGAPSDSSSPAASASTEGAEEGAAPDPTNGGTSSPLMGLTDWSGESILNRLTGKDQASSTPSDSSGAASSTVMASLSAM